MFPTLVFIAVLLTVIFICAYVLVKEVQSGTRRNHVRFAPVRDASGARASSQEHPIPPTMHVMYGLWDTREMPPLFQFVKRKWSEQGWNVKLWDKAMVDELMAQYPRWNSLYRSFRKRVQAADLARLLVLYHEGGFYSDLDCRPNDHVSLFRFVFDRPHARYTEYFFREHYVSPEKAALRLEEEPIRDGVQESLEHVCNYLMGARQHHPYILEMLELMEQRCQSHPDVTREYDVLFTTGPMVVTDVVQQHRGDVRVFDNNIFASHVCFQSWRRDRDVPSNRTYSVPLE